MVRLPEYIQTRVSQLAPRRSGRPYVAGLALTLTLAVAGCATSPDQVVEEPTATPAPEVVEVPKETPPSAVPSTPDKAQPNAPGDSPAVGEKQPALGDMVTVSVYTIDDQCNGFVEEPVEVPSSAAMSEAVGKAVSASDLNAFKLDGYQVNIDGNTAIVDMRLAPGSERQFVSLSSCEQRILFGSVEETLLNNADWDVDAVKFTNAGKELSL
ncbi:MAG: hypothetical protein AAF810_05100 [Cyanobacteria bacterium P01_D01_bin.36]